MMESEQIPPPPDAGDIVVFSVRKDTTCAECGSELFRSSLFILNEERNPLCLRQIRVHFPACSAQEAMEIAQHACRKYSGWVGRSAASKGFDPNAIRLAVVASVRHRFTNCDEQLVGDYDRQEARAMVRPEVEALLASWSRRQHSEESQQRDG
jgi:hypothetical protein